MLRDEGRGVAMGYADFTRIVMGGPGARPLGRAARTLGALLAHIAARPATIVGGAYGLERSDLVGAGLALRSGCMDARTDARASATYAARHLLFASLDDFTLRVHLP